MIRAAEEADLPEVLRMGEAFHAASGLRFAFDPQSVTRLFAAMQVEPNALFVAAENGGLVGMLGLMVYPHPINAGVRVSQELIWWAEKGHSAGMRLLERAEAWARSHGCFMVQMGCLDDLNGDKVAALYRHRGYAPIERSFVRYLT